MRIKVIQEKINSSGLKFLKPLSLVIRSNFIQNIEDKKIANISLPAKLVKIIVIGLNKAKKIE